MKDGPSTIQIADLYGLARQTVTTRWAKRLNSQNKADIEVLKDKTKPARNTRMNPKQTAEIDKILKHSPTLVGLTKEVWTGALLSAYLKDHYNIELKTTMCQRWMRRLEDKKAMTPRR